MEAAVEDTDAVHLPFHQDRVSQLTDSFLRLIQIEQHARLRINRRLWRIQILRSGLLIGRQSTSGEGDDLALLVTDRKRDAVPELAVKRRLRFFVIPSKRLTLPRVEGPCGFLFLPREQARGPHLLVAKLGFHPVAQYKSRFRREADPEM